ncbi:hypothetical protein [Rhizobium leguminosarum]|uniref:hypothetical protein n=1 Tax=Rhizobium leguminosarum TaxID=384 RepID=UPI001C9127E9|nr:hypothetical protein [Rhizobium leguminosarum]MBY2951545.1 hypothetical protein [Rhizobium leguminosarum]
MRQTELTPVQKATARRLSVPAKSALKGLILAEREQYGGLTDAPRLLDAAAAMFEANINTVTIFNMVQHTAEAFQSSIEKRLRKKPVGRPVRTWWREGEVDRESAILRFADEGTHESALEAFKETFAKEIFHLPVRLKDDPQVTTLAEQLELKPGESVKLRDGRVKSFRRALDNAIRNHLNTLKRKRNADRLIADFEEIWE